MINCPPLRASDHCRTLNLERPRSPEEAAVAVVVTAASGFDLGYVWRGQAAGSGAERSPEQREGGYYLGAAEAGEAPGRWYGRGAAALGLAPGSVVERAPYDKVYRQVHPETGEQLGRKPGNYDRYKDHLARLLAAEPYATQERVLELEREAAAATRKSPAYTDVTVSFSKSISILHASIRANAWQARQAEDAERAAYWDQAERRFQEILQEANRAGLEHLQRWAGITRTGSHSARIDGQETGKFETAGLVISSWLQGTSRDGDPQLHVHNQIARVSRTDSDGRWRAVDTMSVRGQLPAVNAIVTAHVEAALSREFGVAWTPRNLDGYGIVNEISGITPEEIGTFSARTAAIHETLPGIVAKWTAKYGREPNRYELLFLQQQATMESRRGKDPDAIDWDAYARKWDAKHGDLAQVAPRVSGLGGASARRDPEPREPSPDAQMRAMQTALETAQRKSATFTRADLMREMARAVHAEDRAGLPPERAVALIGELTGRALAGEAGRVVDLSAPEVVPVPVYLRREIDGRSIYTRPGTVKYATAAQLSREEALLEQAGREGAPHMAREAARERMGEGLREDQRIALEAALASPRRAYLIVGPAGSGKTRVLAEAARVWDGPVIGLAPSQAARNVLAGAAQVPAVNTAQFLGHTETGRGARGPMPLEPGTLLLLDEASMTSMADMADVIAHAERCGAKVLVSGDHAQLAAVEQGGGMGLLASRYEYAQLAEPVRFKNAWERDASLRLRRGDKSVLDTYDEHGRIRGGTYEEALDRARQFYVGGYLQGKDVLLMARDHDTVRELSRRIRDDLIHLGRVQRGPEVRLREGARASAGDLIITRHNEHELGVANGMTWRVEKADPVSNTVELRQLIDADPETGARRFAGHTIIYRNAATHADLAYAVTGHSAQGRTVSRAHAFITGAEDRNWVYVAMSRGADGNWAHVATTPPRMADPRPGTRAAPEIEIQARLAAERAGAPAEAPEASGPERDARGVVSDSLDRDGGGQAALTTQQRNLANADHLGILHAVWQAETRDVIHARYERLLREKLPAGYKDTELSGKATWLYRSLRAAEAAGLDAGEVLARAISARPLDGARDLAAVLDARVREAAGTLAPEPGRSFTERVPDIEDPARQEYVRALAEAMDARKERLGEHVVEAQPEWSQVLGPVPEEPLDRLDWQRRAGEIAAYRETYGFAGEKEPIGPEPQANAPEQREAWWNACAALGRTEEIRRESDGQLLLTRDQYEAETAWAPRHVGRELHLVRTGAEDEELRVVRARAEARAARQHGNARLAARHEEHARRAAALREAYRQHEATLAAAMQARQAWEQATDQARHQAIAADSEYRRRHPGTDLEPLRNAEPEPATDAEREQLRDRDAAWVAEVTERSRRAREMAGQRLPEREADGWPGLHPDAVIRQPAPEIRPARALYREPDYQAEAPAPAGPEMEL
jgi:conjugative relaxase-like TrwC/TraI family protein